MKTKTLKLLLILCLIFLTDIIAQPYVYYNAAYSDTVLDELTIINRYDITNNTDEAFLQPEEYFNPILDPLQSYLFVDIRNWISFLYDCSDTSTHYELNNFLGVQVNELHYSPQRNKLYIFSDDYKNLSVFDFSSDSITSKLNFATNVYESDDLMSPKRNAFFSSSGDYIYFYSVDTLNNVDQVWTYSLDNNEITEIRNLSELGGYPDCDFYCITFGRNGKGIITSGPLYNNPVKDFYYKIYDFDSDSGSPFIYHNGLSEAYFSGNGDFLLIMDTEKDDSLRYYHTGDVEIYDTQNGQLIKTLTLPQGGIVYTFDNYPNNIYYAIDIEERTRQIYTLKIDSILNVLDLTSLNPSSEIVNSPPFTLTINGHGFDSLSTVYFNDTSKTTTYISDSVLTTEISTSDISILGNYPVWVTDEWGTSDTLTFVVDPPPPILTSISPAIVLRNTSGMGISGLTVTATGANFTDSSVAYFNGNTKTTTIVSDTVLTFPITGSDISTVGNYPVWISNYGSHSDTLYILVTDTLPQPITPVLECVHDNGNHTYTAYFGYENDNDVSVYIALGSKNGFSPSPADRGQPKLFLPGEQADVFSVIFNGQNLTWTLDQASVVVNNHSTPCP